MTWLFRGLVWLVVLGTWAQLALALARGKFRLRGGPVCRRDEQPGEFWVGVVVMAALALGVTAFAVWMWVSRVGVYAW
jgi:hypothetical protein